MVYVLDVGRDPVTGRRRQRWRGGFTTKADAERELARQIGGADGHDSIEGSALRVDASLDQWFEGCAPGAPTVDGHS